MDFNILRLKVLNNELCKLCLAEKNEEFVNISEVTSESRSKPEELVEKFNLVEVKIETFKLILHVMSFTFAVKYGSKFNHYL